MDVNSTSPKAAAGFKVKGKVEIDIERCKGCGLCTGVCRQHALTLSGTINSKGYQYIVADNNVCTGCVNCALICPDAVITVYRTRPQGQKKVMDTPADIRQQLQQMATAQTPAIEL